MIATGLGQISTSRYSQLDTQVLEENCHQVRNHDDRQKGVSKPCAPSQIRCPIARIHIADGDQKSRTGEGDQFPPERCRPRHNNAAMNLWQGDLAARFSPGHARFWCNCDIVLCHQLRFEFRLLTPETFSNAKSPMFLHCASVSQRGALAMPPGHCSPRRTSGVGVFTAPSLNFLK